MAGQLTIADVRAKFPQYDDMSDADLASALHQKFYADMPQADFNEKIGLKPDKYRQAAIDERNDLQAKGIDTGAGLTRRLVQGATLNLADEAIAGAMTPLEMIKRGTLDPREAYKYAKAREDLILDDARQNTGTLGTAAEIAGGVGSGLGLARQGVTTARMLSQSPGIVGRTLASAADSTALGGIAGFGSGNSLDDRLANAGQGAAIGAAAGALLPPALAVAKTAASPLISNIMARINPDRYASGQVARAINESGLTTQEVADRLAQANAEGSPYTLADALGNSGQRMLSTVTRAPGQGRTDVVNFLDTRQAGQGRRVSRAIEEGFGSRMTPDELRNTMTAERGAIADEAYGAVRDGAGPVNVRGVVDHIEANVPAEPAAPDTISGRLQRYRRMLTNGDAENPEFISDFEHVQRVRSELADEVQNARQSGQGNRARMLGQVLTQIDDALENASEGFRQANRDFAGATQNIEAIDAGRAAATRGRTEDIIPAYRDLSPRGQQAFRTGYADPLISQTQGAAFGVDKTRPLMNDAFAAEAGEIAPGNPLMQRRLMTEQRMFETRNAAKGNSKTAENLADDAALGVDPGVVGQVLSGNYGGAVKLLISAGSNVVTGNTPAVREAVGRILLRRGVSAGDLDGMIDETIGRIRRAQEMARVAGRGAAGGVAQASTQKKRELRRAN